MVIYRQLENETLELVNHGMVCKAFFLYLTGLTVSFDEHGMCICPHLRRNTQF